jgi:magnesium-transporting ATPase (P-type)
MGEPPPPFWSLSSNELFLQLQSRKEGLTDDEARERLARYGSNLLKPPKRSDAFALLLSQFKSPLALILFFATGLSFFLGNAVDASIILVIVLASGLLGPHLHEKTNVLATAIGQTYSRVYARSVREDRRPHAHVARRAEGAAPAFRANRAASNASCFRLVCGSAANLCDCAQLVA